MKLATLRHGDAFHAGVLIGEDILDLVRAQTVIALAACVPSSIRAILAAKALPVVEQVVVQAGAPDFCDRLRATGVLAPFADATLAPVIPDADLVIAASMNSLGHLAEMGDTRPTHPCAFHKVRSALAASGDDILPPPGHGDMIDWEGEYCLVIGETTHNVSVAEATKRIAGYTLMNDVSAREYVKPFVTSSGAASTAQAWEVNVLGKNYPTFCPLGPVFVTADELPSPLAYHMETVVNGEIMQSSTQDDLVFGPAELISFFSQFYVFQPGDVISFGSPPGVGMARKPQLFLKPGDTVEVRAAGIGSLVNRLAAPAE